MKQKQYNRTNVLSSATLNSGNCKLAFRGALSGLTYALHIRRPSKLNWTKYN